MGELYGPTARLTVSCFTTAIALLVITAQLAFMAKLAAPLLGITYTRAIWWGGVLIVAYAVMGGMRAVAFTDFFQFATLTAVLSLMAYRVIGETGGQLKVFASVYKHYPGKLSFTAHFAKLHLGHISIALEIVFFGVFGGLLSPPIIQRTLLSNKKEDLQRMFSSGASMVPMLYFLFAVIGLGALVLYPQLTRDAILPTLITKLFSGATRGIVLVGLLAVMMSTIDSFLHEAAIAVTSNLIFPNHLFDKEEAKCLRLVRLVTGVLGAVALCIATLFRVNLAFNYIA